jgi:uncharacterized membrane protein YgdD (TMEM256/DUF423 family)
LLLKQLNMNQITNTSRTGNRWIGIGCIFGLLAVGLGAFGAHGLQDYLAEIAQTDPDLAVKRLGNWNTAAQYQMYHALAIVFTGLMLYFRQSRLLSAAAVCFSIGTMIFSGGLYALVLTNVSILGAIVPIGGVSFMVGWALLATAAFVTNSTPTDSTRTNCEPE